MIRGRTGVELSPGSTAVDGGRGQLVAAIFVCALLAASCATARADDEAYTGPRTNLQICLWESDIPGAKRALRELVFSFQRRNPDVVVALEWKEASLAEEYVRRWVGSYADHAPDVTVLTEMWAEEHRGDLLRPPSELTRAMMQRLEPAVVERAGGRPLGVPWSIATPALYYRPDLLREQELQVPGTLDELVECAAAVADPPARFGLGFPAPGQGAEEILHALELAHAPAECARYERALSLVVELQARGALQPETLTWSELELVELLADGRLAMTIAGPWAARVLAKRQAEAEAQSQEAEREGEDAGSDVDVAADDGEQPAAASESSDEAGGEQGVGDGEGEGDGENADTRDGGTTGVVEWACAPLPMADGGAGQIHVDWLVAFRDTDRPEVAVRFLQFMAERKSQRALAMLFGVPATTRLRHELRDVSPWSAHIPALDGGQGLPLEGWEAERAMLGRAIAWALSGRLRPAEALAKAAQEQAAE